MNQPGPVPPMALRWEELLAHADDNLATARILIKDVGSVAFWSRMLVEKSKQLVEKTQAEKEVWPERKSRAEKEAPPDADPVPLFSGETILVIRLVESLDLMTSPQLLGVLLKLAEDALAAKLKASLEAVVGIVPIVADQSGSEQRHRPPVVLDLRSISFIDGSGLSVLVKGRKALHDSGKRLMVLLTPGSQPERVFEGGQLARIITPIPSLDAL